VSPGARALAWRAPSAHHGGTCVFVDRDGVINERPGDGFVLAWEQFRLRPDAIAALRVLAEAGIPAIVASNQSCVGRGLLSEPGLIAIMDRMTSLLEREGAPIAAWYCCPHAPDDGCDCRKPKPGMLLRALGEFALDAGRSHMIGDSGSDIAAGESAGCAAHLIDPSDPTAFLKAVTEIV
jgi:D-glycero-D-manno-heptose 1,7-bisphosphate phosphatase